MYRVNVLTLEIANEFLEDPDYWDLSVFTTIDPEAIEALISTRETFVNMADKVVGDSSREIQWALSSGAF